MVMIVTIAMVITVAYADLTPTFRVNDVCESLFFCFAYAYLTSTFRVNGDCEKVASEKLP